MGGNAFPNLHVPRLPHETYYLIRDRCQKVLETFFEDVVSPPEAPEKHDHGDIDFLVARPKNNPSSIAEAIFAVDKKHTSNSKTTHFALSLPDQEDEYAQVDVHVCPTDYFQWELFLQSYGDLGQILGILNRPIGLTANDKGIHIRIQEIETRNRKRAMILLTSDPDEMLRFLGLDVETYHAGFSTNEEVFSWCFTGRLYGPPKVLEETSNDRTRLRKRDMFVKCIREWFPRHQDEIFPETRRVWTREEVLAEALIFFPHAKAPYDAAMREFRQEIWEERILAAMREIKPEADEKENTEVVRGSKRFVDFVDGEWVLSDTVLREDVGLIPAWLKHVRTEEEKARFLSWLGENWEALHEKERDRMREKEAARLAVKLEQVALAS